MKRPEVKDFDCKPYGYIYAMTIYIETIEKQRDELIEFVVDTMTLIPINSSLYKKADKLLTKTKNNE